MVVFSFDKAKRTIILMAVYLVCTSFLIKGVGYLMEYNFTGMFTSLLNGYEFKVSLPEFDQNTYSFDILANIFKEKVQDFMNIILPTSIGLIEHGMTASISSERLIKLGSRNLILKV